MKPPLLISVIVIVLAVAGGLVWWMMRPASPGVNDQANTNTVTNISNSNTAIDENDYLNEALQDLETVDAE